MHSVCLLRKENGNKRAYYKIADTNSPSYTSGPCDTIMDVAEHVAAMHGVPLGSYYTDLPRYDYSRF